MTDVTGVCAQPMEFSGLDGMGFSSRHSGLKQFGSTHLSSEVVPVFFPRDAPP
jgi:hypothetical protein